MPELESEQERLLEVLIEARRNTSATDRQAFELVTPPRKSFGKGEYPSTISHPGIGRKLSVNPIDAEALFHVGHLRVIRVRGATTYFDVTAEGFQYYENLKVCASEPTARVEEQQRRKLVSEEFLRRHRDAYEKWAAAETLLWGADSPEQLSRIGLLCREALILFTDKLVDKYQPLGVPSDKAKTKDRLGAVVRQAKPTLGATEAQWADSLFAYWSGVAGIAQRVTHAAEKQGDPISWKDARRVVFQTLTLMYEVDDFLEG